MFTLHGQSHYPAGEVVKMSGSFVVCVRFGSTSCFPMGLDINFRFINPDRFHLGSVLVSSDSFWFCFGYCPWSICQILFIHILLCIHTGLTLFVDVLLVENIMCVYNSLVLIYDIWMGSGPPIFFCVGPILEMSKWDMTCLNQLNVLCHYWKSTNIKKH